MHLVSFSSAVWLLDDFRFLKCMESSCVVVCSAQATAEINDVISVAAMLVGESCVCRFRCCTCKCVVIVVHTGRVPQLSFHRRSVCAATLLVSSLSRFLLHLAIFSFQYLWRCSSIIQLFAYFTLNTLFLFPSLGFLFLICVSFFD